MDVNSNGTISKNGTNNNHKNSRRYVVIQNKLSLDPEEPVPISFSGDSFQYARDKRYIPFLDSNDNLANILLEARLGSATQHACIDSISRSLIGNGLAVEGVESPNKNFFNWTKNVNNKNQSFTEFLIQAVDGERAFGNQFIEIKRGKIGSEKYIKVHLHSFLFCRLKSMPDFSEPTAVIMSKLIAKKGYQTFGKKAAVEIPLWSPSKVMQPLVWTKNSDGSESTMLHVKNEISGIENYGLPGSISSLRYQAIEAKLAQYNIDNLDNNLILGGILQVKGGLTQGEAEVMAEDILMTHIGQGKTGRIAVIASEDGIDDTKFTQFNTEKDGSFLEFDKQVQEKIIISNAWDSVLAGINRNSRLGNASTYIRSIWDVKDANLMHPLRTKIIEKVVKPIVEIYVDWIGDNEILDYPWKLLTSMPYSYMADLDPNKFFQVNEAREKAGLKPDDNMKGKYLAEITGPQQPNQFNNGFTQTEGTNKPGEKNNNNQTQK